MANAAYSWGTSDELHFLRQLADCNPAERPSILAQYARTLDLRHDWQGIDPWAIQAALKRYSIDWTPPAGVVPVRRWLGK